jgi:hypothetical protein
MTKNLITLLVCIVTFTFSFAQDVYESAWLDKANEMTTLTIEKVNGDYWLEINSEKFKVLDKSKPSVKIDGNHYKIVIDEERGILVFNETEFIPEFKSKKRRFSGTWKSTKNSTEFDIKLSNGGITWDIIKNKDKSTRFYPKLTETGFTFTIGDEQLFFTITNGIMTDSNGNEYIQIKKV